MALSATVVWEVQTGGADTNGGGYKSDAGTTDYSQQDAPQLALTDVVANGSTTLTSVTGGFTDAMVGNVCYVAGGTGSIVAGWYEIATRSDTNTITVDRATGLTAGTGVTCNVGGALASPGQAAAVMTVSGQRAWVKSGAYTLTTATPGAAGPISFAAYNLVMSGYQTTRGDRTGVQPVVSWGAVAAPGGVVYIYTATGAGNLQIFDNLSADGNDVANVGGFWVANGRWTAYYCTAVNCSDAAGVGFRGVNGAISTVACRATDCYTGFNGGIHKGSVAIGGNTGFYNVWAFNCIAHGCSANGYSDWSHGYGFSDSIADGCATGFQANGYITMFQGCIASNNSAYGFNLATGINNLLSCASYNNTSGIYDATPLLELGTVTLSADPYVNVAGHDFRLNNAATGGALCIEAGIGVYGQTGPAHVGAVAPAIDFPAVGEVETAVTFGYNSTLTGTATYYTGSRVPAGDASNITYDAPSETFEVTNGTSGSPIVMEDIYEYAYNNALFTGADPVVESSVAGEFLIRANINFGDGSTSTYFTSLNEMVYFADTYSFKTLAAATLQLGELGSLWGKSGSTWSYGGGSALIVNNTVAAATLIYGSTLIYRGGQVQVNGGTLTMLNSTVSSLSLNYLSALTLKRLNINGPTSGIFAGVTPDVVSDILIHSASSRAIQLSVDGTVFSDITFDNNPVDVWQTNAGTMDIINPTPSIGTLLFTDAGSIVRHRELVNIHVADKDGANLATATVACTTYGNIVSNDAGANFHRCIVDHTAGVFADDLAAGKWEVTTAANAALAGVTGAAGAGAWVTGVAYVAAASAFSVTTDANGDIAEQTVTFKTWIGTSEAMLSYSPHVFTISKANYETLTLEAITVDAPIVWSLELQDTTPVRRVGGILAR